MSSTHERPVFLREPPSRDTRTPEELREHYLVEKELAALLRDAARPKRLQLYSWAYEELYRRVPHHPQLRYKSSPEEQRRRVAKQLEFLGRWLTPDAVFLEIGAGDCALSFAVAARVARVYAVDVSESITRSQTRPPNFTLALSDGTSIPTPPGEITLAYSNQLMEHLHPDDALEQLRNIYRALAPGGAYVCVTPNRLSGPYDISLYFDEVASGFHLKEYTATELHAMFRRVGFRSVRQWVRTPRGYAAAPNALTHRLEQTLGRLRPAHSRRLLNLLPLRGWRNVRLLAVK